MPIQRRIAQIGLAKQTALGSPVVTPTYGLGLADGQVLVVDIAQEPDELTLVSGRVSAAAFRTEAIPGAEFSSRAWPRSIGLLLYAALGAVSTAGGAPPYTHTISPADDLPYLTVHGRQGSNYYRTEDAKLDELTLSWNKVEPIAVDAKFIGTKPGFVVAWTPTNDESAEVQFQGSSSGSFKVDAASATPATANISAGSLKIANNLEPLLLSNDIAPKDVFPATHEIEMGLTLIPDNLDEWRKIVTGSAGGTTVQASPVYGSFEIKFVIDASTDLVINATRVAFMADFPGADAGGGLTELEMVGTVLKPAGAAITAILRNTIASY